MVLMMVYNTLNYWVFGFSIPNITKKELKAMKSLKLNIDIRILQADNGQLHGGVG
jgi:hypothetical protein